MDLQALNDRDLLSETERVAQAERECTITLLFHLNEIGRRKLHIDLGYQSLFAYCTRKLKYSSSAAGRRLAAARCIRRFPEVLAMLKDRELSLCTVALIEPILNEENAPSILERVRNASRREVERVVCEFRPPVALRDRIRPVRVATSMPVEIDALLFERECSRTAPWGWEDRRRIEEKLFVEFLADEALVTKFEEARALLCGRHSEMSFADVLNVLVTEFLDRRSPSRRHERRKKDENVHTPTGGSTGTTHSRHIPAAVRDEVFTRDGGRCSFVGTEGTRCESRRGLEIDHIVPFSAGGTNDPSNLRLLCPAHNLRAAERTLGTHVMAQFWKRE